MRKYTVIENRIVNQDRAYNYRFIVQKCQVQNSFYILHEYTVMTMLCFSGDCPKQSLSSLIGASSETTE